VTAAVRIGVATGHAVVGDLLETGGRSELAALGHTPNMATRLQGVAGPNQLVVSATTVRFTGALLETEAIGPCEGRNVCGAGQPGGSTRSLGKSARGTRTERAI
jgi:class 3 adenylate cyclase